VEVDGEEADRREADLRCWIEAWTPGDTIAAARCRTKALRHLGPRRGTSTRRKGQSIRFDHVAQALADDTRDFEIGMVAYDRYAFRRFEEECAKLGLSILSSSSIPRAARRRASRTRR
jgi:hypothetical protein